MVRWGCRVEGETRCAVDGGEEFMLGGDVEGAASSEWNGMWEQTWLALAHGHAVYSLMMRARESFCWLKKSQVFSDVLRRDIGGPGPYY
mmetsp:Transcript_17147/g.45869  ORF Transcript_17147/g.45869 Transcript_17147/m.45869 type:complete len:89 (-) Transcript_17147:275-541(-)